ncbi:uncharacterized protein DUF488 [Actinomycetospora succinea]|uniref:Uncharacterized protein DUF488 n=1 Tax=Actinomycetospora succinea TaxID=663603 RepID=A0A4R6UKZ6_9PSEU|nr:DUF488 domain-containing protein [Actinomycetospora succinea]TDQ46169.1 uncharacterized protein DUF488 [Actinomycetospora succinea]
MDTLWTVGHGTLDGPAVARLVADAGIAAVVDVRRYPGSRRDPSVAREALGPALTRVGVAYRWDERLGGRRSRPNDSPDTALRDRAFAGYAAHMRTPVFTDAVDELLGAPEPTAILCSESVWWRCHRRLVADHVVLVRDTAVRHLMHDGRTPEHHPTDGVRHSGDQLVYDAGQEPLPGTG